MNKMVPATMGKAMRIPGTRLASLIFISPPASRYTLSQTAEKIKFRFFAMTLSTMP
jgi:hypothetical protein